VRKARSRNGGRNITNTWAGPIDNDPPGRAHAQAIAESLSSTASRIRLFDPAKHWPDCPEGGDISDWLDAGHSVELLWEIVGSLPEWTEPTKPTTAPPQTPEDHWPQPKELPSELAKVDAFDSSFLPERLAPWVNDISDRLQCPPDYVAVAAITALGATIGRRIAIAPQQKTDWYEVPNLWGAFVGRPGMLKSPAMNEALKPLRHLEAEAAKSFEIAQEAYSVGISEFKLRAEVKKSLQREHLKKTGGSNTEPFTFDLGEEPKEPVAVRFRTNDSSYERLGELLVDNPSGILIERDELISLLRHLDRDDQANARGFYLSGWSGQSPYTFDRIVRGHKHIDAVCLSVLGNTQPSKIAEYVHRANADGGGGDGLIQRFGLLVWPDTCPDWRNVDQFPDSKARETAREIFRQASEITLEEAIKRGATKTVYEAVPFLRFDETAHGTFLEWRSDLEARLRREELSAAMEGHLAKYRKLVPALALINHIADGCDGPVSNQALLKALAFARYLETHARRVYGAHNTIEVSAAKAILTHICKGNITGPFTARDIHQRDWSRLTDRAHVQLGLDLLVELGHLAATPSTANERGGRPTVTYEVNPMVLK
jgi:putative DNA primase/helicase